MCLLSILFLSELSQWAGLYLHIFQIDLMRYLLGAGLVFLLINLTLRKALAGRKIRLAAPDGLQMRREFLTSMRTVAIFAANGTIVFYLREAGLIEIYLDPAERGWLYFAYSVIALILLHDAWFYWTHRLIHHPRVFRRLHRTHHRSQNPSPWTAYSFDIGEAAINAVFFPLALLLVTASPLAILIFLTHMILRNAIGHCGYEIFPSTREGRPWFDWMTTVTHHDLHHAQAGWNFGFYFTFWDRLMGTEHPLYHEKFAEAVRKPLDGSAMKARTGSAAYFITAAGFLIATTSCVSTIGIDAGQIVLNFVGAQAALSS